MVRCSWRQIKSCPLTREVQGWFKELFKVCHKGEALLEFLWELGWQHVQRFVYHCWIWYGTMLPAWTLLKKMALGWMGCDAALLHLDGSIRGRGSWKGSLSLFVSCHSTRCSKGTFGGEKTIIKDASLLADVLKADVHMTCHWGGVVEIGKEIHDLVSFMVEGYGSERDS